MSKKQREQQKAEEERRQREREKKKERQMLQARRNFLMHQVRFGYWSLHNPCTQSQRYTCLSDNETSCASFRE